MKIRKHKIKVSRDDDQSSFLTDLRPKSGKFSRHHHENGDYKKRSSCDNFIKKDRRNPFSFVSISRFRKIFFFPLFLLIFKLFKNVFQESRRFVASFNKRPALISAFFQKPKLKKKKKTTSNKFKFFQFEKKSKRKSVLLFFCLLLLLVLPFKLFTYYKLIFEDGSKERIMDTSFSALESFVLASDDISNFNLASAQQNFFQAGQNFIALERELGNFDELLAFLASFSSNDKIRLASESKNIASVGYYLSSSGDNLSLALDALLKSFSSSEKLDDNLSDFYFYTEKVENDFKEANKRLQSIKISSIPSDYRDDFVDLKNLFNILESNISSILSGFSGLRSLLGMDIDKRYLLVFQNNAEMRASGGFIGSHALLDIRKGEIKNIEAPSGGSYDTEGGLRVLVEAPKPLHLLSPVWSFWNANWWPDWKMSAQNLMWFYEKSDGPSVDGVIALTPDVLVDILKITGEIDLRDKYGVLVNSDNAWDILQEIVEVIGQPEFYEDKDLKTDILDRLDERKDLASSTDESKELFLRNEPKEIIGDLMSAILDEFSDNLSKETLLEGLSVLEKNLSEKNILLYFNDDEIQDEVESRSWGGRIKESPLDYLMIVDTNIGGGKTDRFIDSSFSLDVEIDENGDIINRLRIEKKHQGIRGHLFSGVRNVNWLRVYVPMGSKIISASGFSQPDIKFFEFPEDDWLIHPILKETEELALIDSESGLHIYQENEKTVFANWTMTDPGEVTTIKIRYELPFQFRPSQRDKNYLDFINALLAINQTRPAVHSLLVQKQPGNKAFEFFSRLRISDNYQIDWRFPEEINIVNDKNDAWFIKDILDKDKFYAILALPQK